VNLSEGDRLEILVIQTPAFPGVVQDTSKKDLFFFRICVLFNSKSEVLQNRITINPLRT